MGNFVKYLSKKLTEREVRYNDLAKFLGCNPTYISQLLKRPTPPDPRKTGIYKKLDSYFHEKPGTFEALAMNDLYGGDSLYDWAKKLVGDDSLRSRKTPQDSRVPVLGYTEGSHPELCEFDATVPTQVEEYVDAPPGGNGQQFYALRVKGASMSPRYNDGDIVYLAPGLPVGSGEEAIVVLEGGECMLKKIKITDDSVILISIQGEPVVVPRSKVLCMHRLMWVKR